jgi:nucleotide-binding universal stress UspA family protein
MNMFHKVVVALDYSDFSPSILDTAIALAKITDAQLKLVHVVSLEDGSGYQPLVYAGGFYSLVTEQQFDQYREAWTKFKKQNLDKLEADTEAAKAAGVSAESFQIDGSPGRSICEFAKSWGADLILMGRHGRTGISELFLGSVSNYVLHHSPCAVLTLNIPSHGSVPDESDAMG